MQFYRDSNGRLLFSDIISALYKAQNKFKMKHTFRQITKKCSVLHNIINSLQDIETSNFNRYEIQREKSRREVCGSNSPEK